MIILKKASAFLYSSEMALIFVTILASIAALFQPITCDKLYTTFQLSEPQIDSLLKQAAEGANFVCPEASGRFASGDDCTRFYSCDNFRGRMRQCVTGLMFDSLKKRCVPQSQAVCGRQELECPAPPQGRQESFICPTAGIAGYPDTRNCSKYNLCIFSRRFELECSAGRLFDSPSRRCVATQDAKCETSENLSCPENGIYSHPYGCDRYYKCCNGQATVEYCGTGRLFNTKQCVWSLGILERCPQPPTTPMPLLSSPSSNITLNGPNGTVANMVQFEPLENTDDDSTDIAPTVAASSDNEQKTMEEQRLEVEKLINELSGIPS